MNLYFLVYCEYSLDLDTNLRVTERMFIHIYVPIMNLYIICMNIEEIHIKHKCTNYLL